MRDRSVRDLLGVMSVKTKEGESSFRQGMSLDCNTDLIKPVNPKGTQSWIFIGGTDAEADVPILWPPEAKSCLTWKRPWCWERLKAGGEGATQDEMVGWHHHLKGHEFEQTSRSQYIILFKFIISNFLNWCSTLYQVLCLASTYVEFTVIE